MNYHGLNGIFCYKCYDLVAHDSFGKPKNKKSFEQVKIILTLKQGSYHEETT